METAGSFNAWIAGMADAICGPYEAENYEDPHPDPDSPIYPVDYTEIPKESKYTADTLTQEQGVNQ